jgi:hypothetical protein
VALAMCLLFLANRGPIDSLAAHPAGTADPARTFLQSTVLSVAAGDQATPAAAPAAYRPELRRYPYLTDTIGPYATINWMTDRSGTTGSVAWGRAGVESCTAHSTPAIRTSLVITPVLAYQWTAPLTLTAGTAYCYRVYLDALDLLNTDPSPQFWTQVPAGDPTPFSFAVFGDWGWVDGNGTNPDQANVMARIAASGARFALTTGDNAYPSGSQNNYGDLYQVGPNRSGVFGPAFWTVAGARMPLFPAIGNHGFARNDTIHPHLLNWPEDEAVATSGGRYLRETYCCVNDTNPGTYPSIWYAFDAGQARFYVLEAAWDDGNLGTGSSYANDYAAHWTPSSPEYQWLEQDLLTHPSLLKFAFWHYPLYSDQSVDESDPFLQGSNSLEGLLARYGVNIGFTGHAHIYQRNLKLSPDSLVTYVTGGGGADLEPVGAQGCSPVDAYGIGWSYSSGGTACGSAPVPTSITQVFHFLLVSVNGTQVTVAPTDELGRTFDVQTYNFPAPTATPTTTPTSTPTPTHTSTTTLTSVPTDTPSPTVTDTPSATFTDTPSPTPSPTPSLTPSPTSSATGVPVTGTPTVCAVQFVDVPPGHTFYDSIHCLACQGIIQGYPCGGPGEPCPGAYFRPNNNVTRGQTAKIVAEAGGFAEPVPSTQQTFQDVAPGSTFYLWIERLAGRGIIQGYPCGGPGEACVAPDNRPYFRPNNNVTRGQIAKVVAEAAGWTETPTAQTFEDVPPGSTFYLYVERVAGRGIIQGYPCGGAFEPCIAPANRPYFRPSNNATRGQLSKIAANTFYPNCQAPARR